MEETVKWSHLHCMVMGMCIPGLLLSAQTGDWPWFWGTAGILVVSLVLAAAAAVREEKES